MIRTFYGKGTKKLFDLGEQRADELQRLMSAVPGLVSYPLARNGNGGFSVTVCQHQRGIQQSLKVARDFLASHAPGANLAAMQISAGKVITHVQSAARVWDRPPEMAQKKAAGFRPPRF